MSPEDAYSILEAIAEINGRKDKLKLIAPTENEKNEEKLATDLKQENIERMTPFNFNLVKIQPGEKIIYTNISSPNNLFLCVVLNDKQFEYNGERWSLSALATTLSNSKWGVAGPRFFKYKGEWLNDIRKRMEETAGE